MSLKEKFKEHRFILGSRSPRRQQFLKDLGLKFEIRLKEVEENYPKNLQSEEIANHIAKLKTEPYLNELTGKDILITGDTIVWHKDQVLHKPKTRKEAVDMLKRLSNDHHEVVSATCITSREKSIQVHGKTKVYFNSLSPDDIHYYIDNFQPYDKAGAYGIQEWIGKIGIEKIEGSFYNVMGMPISKVYRALKEF